MWFLILLLFTTSKCIAVEKEADLWNDPNDPSAHKSVIKSVSTEILEKKDQSLRLILRQFMHEIHVDYSNPDYVHRNVKIEITKHGMTTISKYLNEEVEDSIGTRENLRSALSSVFTVQEDSPLPTWQDSVRSFQPYLLLLNIFILPAAAVVVIRSIVKPRNFWILVVSSLILISIYSGYNKKYQEAEARRFAQFQQFNGGHVDACAPESLVQRMFEIVASPFVYSQKSNCLKYIESQTISIFHEISIIEVLSETVSSGFFAFLPATAKHINRFFRELYEGTPLIAQIVMTVFLLLMVGTVRTPLFSYEPLLLTFGSTTIGKIVGWLEGGDTVANNPVQINTLPPINKPAVEAPKPKAIELPKTTEKQKKRRSEKIEVPIVPETHSSGDESQKDSETEWNEARNASSLSESST